MNKKYMNKKCLRFCAAISVRFGENALPVYVYEIEQRVILHLEELTFYVEDLIQMIAGKLVLKEFLSDIRIIFKIAIGVIFEESEDNLPIKVSDVAVKVPEGNSKIEQIVYEEGCQKSQFQDGTADELKAIVPEIEKDIAWAILEAFAQE